MKVILTADLPHVGDVGQVVDVANGYGRNYLIPRGFAILATPRNERSLAQQQKARLAREAKDKAEAEALATQLQALALSIAKKTGEGERLYGSVTSMDIADLLKARGILTRPESHRARDSPEDVRDTQSADSLAS